MEFYQEMLVIAICGIVTIFLRFLPFVVFKNDKEVNGRVNYLGRALPAALFAMLVVYCFKDVDFSAGTFGIPEVISVIFIAAIHIRWRNMFLSLVGGVAFYIVLDWVIGRLI